MNKPSKKPAGKAPARRQAIKRTAPRPSADGKDLLKLAAAVRDQLDIADAGPSIVERGLTAVQHQLEGDLTYSDTILMAKFIRELGGWTEDEAFAGIAVAAEAIAWEDPDIIRLSKAIEAKYKEYGAADDEYWPEGEAPEDMEELRTAFDGRFLQLRVAVLRKHGEDGMADFLMNDPAAFQDRVERGRKVFDERKGKE